MHAALKGDHSEVNRLLLSGEDPNAVDASGKTALFYAVASQHPDAHLLIVELIKHGCLMNTKDETGFTFIDYAAAKNASKILDMVIDLIDASQKEGKNTIGLLIRIDDPNVRTMLKTKLGSKHFKYFDNKFRKKSKKTLSSGASNMSSCNSIGGLKFGEKDCTTKCQGNTGKAAEKRRNDKSNGNSIEPFSLREANEIRSQGVGEKRQRGSHLSHWHKDETDYDDLPKPKAGQNHKGWLNDDDADSEDAKLNFKTMDLIRKTVDHTKRCIDTDIELSVSQLAVQQFTSRKSAGLEDDKSGNLFEKEADFEKIFRKIEANINDVSKVS